MVMLVMLVTVTNDDVMLVMVTSDGDAGDCVSNSDGVHLAVMMRRYLPTKK
jgi:hypothetical protein